MKSLKCIQSDIPKGYKLDFDTVFFNSAVHRGIQSKSVLDQSYPNIQLVVVGDVGTDGRQGIIR